MKRKLLGEILPTLFTMKRCMMSVSLIDFQCNRPVTETEKPAGPPETGCPTGPVIGSTSS
jgi:hypothetical protein